MSSSTQIRRINLSGQVDVREPAYWLYCSMFHFGQPRESPAYYLRLQPFARTVLSRLNHHQVRALTVALGLASSLMLSGCDDHATTTAAIGKIAAPSTDIRFVDTAKQAGINYTWSMPKGSPRNILQTIGNGCAFLDYNNDGNLDIFLVGPKLALYKGDGRGHFVDVTHQTHLDQFHGHFLGCAVGDYDNDGYDDIYVTAYRGGLLLHNEHGRYFTDATAGSGLKPQPWGTSAAWVQTTKDGKLDLYIGNYVVFGPSTKPQSCQANGWGIVCPPTSYLPLRGVLYRNLGGGKFTDITGASGADKIAGKTLGVACADFDASGRQSIALANDEAPEGLLKNIGGSFKNIGAPSGVAESARGFDIGGMGIDWGDYDNDGRLDLALATYQHESKCVYHNDGDDLFTERSRALGIERPTTEKVAFGLKWIDVDNDGWLDLMIANGHVEDDAGQAFVYTTYRQKTQLFYNRAGRRFDDLSSALIGGAGRPIVGRGLAVGDYENNGRMDALIVDSDGQPVLLRNETADMGHWLEFKLIGTKSNRDGLGALITLDAGNLKLLEQCTTSGSYMSASDKRVHFGLGPATIANNISIRWPSRAIDTYPEMRADQIVTLREGDSSRIRARSN
jgi:enediyne biosynthesis protein E4